MSAEPLDAEHFNELVEDFDRQELAELIELFVTTGDQQISDVLAATSRGDHAAAAAAAHSLKGGALGLGARAVADAAGEVEVLARAEQQYADALVALQASWPVTLDALREHVQP